MPTDNTSGFDGDDLDLVIDALEELLHERGRLTASDALDQLRGTPALEPLETLGFDDAMLADVLDELLDELPTSWPLPSDDPNAPMTHLSTPATLHGRSLTVRVTDDEARHRVIDPDIISVLDFDVGWGEHLAITGGGEFTLDDHPVGPDGSTWGVLVPDHVGPLSEGDIVAFTRRGDSVTIEVVSDDDVDADDAEIAALGNAMARATTNGVGTEPSPLLIEMLGADETLFRRPTRPVAELLEEAGFERRDAWWGPSDREWVTPSDRHNEIRRSAAAETYGLADRGRAALDRVCETWLSWARRNIRLNDRATAEVALDGFADDVGIDMVGQAFFDLHRNHMCEADDRTDLLAEPPPGHINAGFRRFVEAVGDASPGSAGVSLLEAFVAELAGDARATEAHLRAVLRDQPNHGTALLRAMVLMVDQNRFDEALRFNNRLFGGNDANAGPLRRYADAMITAGRNDRCPCGSGRKYKQCHDGIPLLGEPEATQSLVFKVERFTDDAAYTDQYHRWPAEAHRVIALVEDPATRDLLVHEGGFLQRYLDERLAILPPADIERLRGWLDLPRDLYEIVEVDPGLRLGVRNVRTGERLDLVEHLGSLDAKVGEYRWMRIEHHNGVHASIGVVFPVPMHHVDRVLDMIDNPYLEVDDIVAWLDDRSAPPTMTTRDGELMAQCWARVHTSASPVDAARLLDEAYGEGPGAGGDPFERSWTAVHRPDPDDPDNWVRASFELTPPVEGGGVFVEVDTLSEARHDRYVAELLELLPDGGLDDESFEPIDVAALGARHDDLEEREASFFPQPADPTPEMQQAMRDWIANYERKWLDEQIPALGDVTPREAAADPTRRPDLLRLLRTFGDDPDGMSGPRLMQALGLDEDE